MDGKVALITGASRGIGKEIALAFAKEGAKVVVNYLSQEGKAEEVVQEIKRLGADAIKIQADVSKIEEVEDLVKSSKEAFGRLDILVNNAGIYNRNAFLESNEEIWNNIINTNLKGAFFSSRLAAEIMEEGAIINMASGVAIKPYRNAVEYAVAKAGVIQLTRTLALTLAPKIRVNCIVPSFVSTDLTGYEEDPEKKAEREKIIPLGRVIESKDVAEAAVYLAKAKNVTGELVKIDGGFNLT